MTNGHFDFELEGVNYSLHFGMTAIQIFYDRTRKDALEYLKDNPEDLDLTNYHPDDIKNCASMIYAGLCNNADREESKRPSFKEAYDLTEKILSDAPKELQDDILNAYNNSRATQKQKEMLGIKEKEEEAEHEKKKKQTGTRSKPTPTVT